VRSAIADMQVAAWNPHRVVPSFRIQVNAHRLDAARRRQVKMESESLNEPTALAFPELNVEEQPAPVGKFRP